MNTAQYAELFLTEGREHLSAINHSLLALERGDGGAAGGDAIATIFRAVHTIKGMSATMGYAAVAELSHELETLLDRMRRGEIAASQAVTDTLFAAVDTLERGIELSVAGRTSDVNAARELARIRTFAAPVPIEAERVAPAEDGWTVAPPPGAGVLVRVRLDVATPLRGVRAGMVVQALRRLGDVLVVAPSVEALQAEQFDRDFALRLDTVSSGDDIARAAKSVGDVAAVAVGDALVQPDVAAEPRAAGRAGGGGGGG
ncbi:MAG: Hpt domain-containing protein, partial [Gemmatimonadaceae bacterium]